MAGTNQDLLMRLQAQMRFCRRCRDAGLPVGGRPLCSGPASAGIMIVGQAPSRNDHLAQQLWSGAAGRRLMGWLSWAGLREEALRDRQYMTTVVRCYRGRGSSGGRDRVPSRAEMKLCRPYLDAELLLVAPQLLIPVGRLAIDSFGGMGQRLRTLVGTAVCVYGTWIVPLPHPSGANFWLGRWEHRQRLARALALIRELAQGLGLV